MPVSHGPGSIAFVGFNADGEDNLAFVTFEPIEAGTTIHFTNNYWDGSLADNAATWSWTAGADIAAGTVVALDALAGDTPTSDLGAVVKAGTRDVDNGNEVIYAYVGERGAPDAFLSAVASDGFSNGDDLFGTGLVAGETAVDFDLLDGDLDVAEYVGRRVSLASFDELRLLVNDHNNWISQDSGGDQDQDGIEPDVPFNDTSFAVDPDANAVSFAADSLAVSVVEGDSDTVFLTFTVERTGSLSGDVVVSGTVVASGVIDAADFGGSLPTEFATIIPDGAATGTITIEVSGDTQFEQDEPLTLTLTEATNAAVPAYVAGTGFEATGVIENDDALPVDIAFVGYNAEGAAGLAFVALDAIDAGTVIHFTDKPWLGDTFHTSGSAWTFTAEEDVPAGAIVTMDGLARDETATSNFGAIAFTNENSRSFSLHGEVVYAYLGEAEVPTAFLGAIATTETYAGPFDNTGLVEGENALILRGGVDIGAYEGPRHGAGDLAEFRAQIHNAANWRTQTKDAFEEANDGYGPEAPFSREGFTTEANPQTLGLVEVSVRFAEGSQGFTEVTFTVERAGGTLGDVAFAGSVLPLTTSPDDFGGIVPSFYGTLADGEAATSVTVSIDGDIVFEPDETFQIALDRVVNSDAPIVLGGTAVAEGVVENDDIPQEIAFATETVEIVEGDAGTQTISFTVTRSGSNAPDGEVSFTGTVASLGVDADDFAGMLPTTFAGVFADGESAVTVSFEIAGDLVVEGDERFTLMLDTVESATVPVTLGEAASATGIILDNEPVPSIAFVGFNADGEDDLAFAVLSDVEAGTVIHFTDANWNGSAFPTNSESHFSWTATEAVKAGTIIAMNGLAYGGSPNVNIGEISYSSQSNNTINYQNEAVYAYVGAQGEPARFLAAIANDSFGAASSTLEGTGLVEGVDAIALGAIASDVDVGVYDGLRAGLPSIEDYKALINDTANWVIDSEGSGSNTDNSSNGIFPDTPFSEAPFLTDADPYQTVGFAAGSLAVSVVEGDAGTALLTFTLERSGDVAGTLDVVGSVATGGTLDADDFGGTLPTFAASFADGETATTVSIAIAGDTLVERDEAFSVTLQNATSGGAVAYIDKATQTAVGTIENDDVPALADIAFTGRSSVDGGSLAFVALGDIEAGTEIGFTDRSWNGETFVANALIGEGSVWTWTATADIAAGNVITMAGLGAGFAATSNLGTIAFLDEAERDINAYDNIYAFSGDVAAPDAFLTAISHSWYTPPSPNVYVTGLLDGTGLVEGETALLLHQTRYDISQYDGAREDYPSIEAFREGLFDPANWIGQSEDVDDPQNDGIAPDLPLDATPFTVDPDAQLIGFDAASLEVVMAEGDAGTTAMTFTVERTNGTDGELTFEGEVIPGSTDSVAVPVFDGTTLTDADFVGGRPMTFSGVIADGATSGTVTIEVAGDTVFEPSEGFRLRLTGGDNGGTSSVAIGTNARAIAIIENDDARDSDIAFVGADLYNAQSLAFVALSDMAAGTEIHFTNRFWNGEEFYEETGAVVSFTADAAIAAGTVITLDDIGANPASDLGSLAVTGRGSLVYSSQSEGTIDIYAYGGEVDAPDVFLTALTTGSFGSRDDARDPDERVEALQNTGLATGVDVIDRVGGAGAYSGPRAGFADVETLRALLSDRANWRNQDEGDHEDADTVFPDAPLSTLPFSLDPAAQVVGFVEPLSIARPEEDGGAMTAYTFTVERSGDTTGAIAFTGHVLVGDPAEGATITADDFGGVAPQFAGVIAAGETTTTVEIMVYGDDLYEGDEVFTLQLDTIENSAGAPVGAGVYLAEGIIVDYDAQPSAIAAGESVTATVDLFNGDNFVIEEGGALSLGEDGTAFRWLEDGTSSVENHGLIRAENMLSTTAEGSLIFNNETTGIVIGEWDPDGAIEPGSVIVINNAGTMKLQGRLFDFHDVVKGGGHAEVNNLAGGLMESTEADTDMIRVSARGVVNNAGMIRMVTIEPSSGDAIDFQDNVGGVVNNFAGGTIIGARHAVTGDKGVVVSNAAGGTMIGMNGGAVNIDNSGSEGERVFVTNRGTMEGRSEETKDSDGDAIDIDGLLTLKNFGFVGGMGHHGRHDGEPNISEGLAIGGGKVVNRAGGEIYGYGRAIQVDNSENDDAFAATRIVNEGLIHGDGNDPEGTLQPGELEEYSPLGTEAINLVGEYGDNLKNSGTIEGGVAMGGGDDVLRNTGEMTAGGGTAIDMGEGNDRVLMSDGGSVIGRIVLGTGDDKLTAGDAAIDVAAGEGADTVTGGAGDDSVDGGAGTDVIKGKDGADALRGRAHADTVKGGAGDDGILGGGGADLITGDAGDDDLGGGKSADTVKGGEGDDTIVGGDGDDLLFGNDGADAFVFDASAGSDRVADFAAGEGDTLTFEGVFAGFADFSEAASDVGDDVEVDLGAGSILTLSDTDLDDITSALVIFA